MLLLKKARGRTISRRWRVTRSPVAEVDEKHSALLVNVRLSGLPLKLDVIEWGHS